MTRKNQELTLNCERLGADMEGVCSHEGMTVFVPMALPGESVNCIVTHVKPRYAFARLIGINTRSPDRREPFCAKYRFCGGCSAQHMSYELSLLQKRAQVVDCLTKIAGIPNADGLVAPVIGAFAPRAFRNKTSLPVSGTVDAPEIGFYRRRSHDVVPIEACPVAMGDISGVIACVKEWMRLCRVPPYDESTGKGLIRHVITRSNRRGDMLVLLSINDSRLPDADKLIELLKERVSGFCALHITVNRRRDNVILGDTSQKLCGEDCITETLLSLSFEISPLSFFQVNPEQTEKLYSCAIDMLDPREGEICVDAYAGAGTMALLMAKRANKVIGVEIVPQAVDSAIRSARRNGIDNAEFITGAVESVLPKLVENGLRPSAVMLDPPRKGVEPQVIDAVAASGASRLVYVSCYPPTQARDIKALIEKGFRLISAQPVDLFCYASGVENVALLAR